MGTVERVPKSAMQLAVISDFSVIVSIFREHLCLDLINNLFADRFTQNIIITLPVSVASDKRSFSKFGLMET